MMTIVGLFDDEMDAHKVIQRLMEAGIERDDITLMTSTVESFSAMSQEPEWISGAANRVDIDPNTGDYADHLKGLNVPDQDANFFDQEVRRGQTLVAISTSEDMEDRVMGIMNSHGAKNIGKSYTGKSKRAVM